jgi:hypothetical protein
MSRVRIDISLNHHHRQSPTPLRTQTNTDNSEGSLCPVNSGSMPASSTNDRRTIGFRTEDKNQVSECRDATRGKDGMLGFVVRSFRKRSFPLSKQQMPQRIEWKQTPFAPPSKDVSVDEGCLDIIHLDGTRSSHCRYADYKLDQLLGLGHSRCGYCPSQFSQHTPFD